MSITYSQRSKLDSLIHDYVDANRAETRALWKAEALPEDWKKLTDVTDAAYAALHEFLDGVSE